MWTSWLICTVFIPLATLEAAKHPTRTAPSRSLERRRERARILWDHRWHILAAFPTCLRRVHCHTTFLHEVSRRRIQTWIDVITCAVVYERVPANCTWFRKHLFFEKQLLNGHWHQSLTLTYLATNDSFTHLSLLSDTRALTPGSRKWLDGRHINPADGCLVPRRFKARCHVNREGKSLFCWFLACRLAGPV